MRTYVRTSCYYVHPSVHKTFLRFERKLACRGMCSLCRLPVAKATLFWQILTFGAPVLTPFYRRGPNLVCYSRPTLHVYVSKFVLIDLFYRPLVAKTPNFCLYLDFGI